MLRPAAEKLAGLSMCLGLLELELGRRDGTVFLTLMLHDERLLCCHLLL